MPSNGTSGIPVGDVHVDVRILIAEDLEVQVDW